MKLVLNTVAIIKYFLNFKYSLRGRLANSGDIMLFYELAERWKARRGGKKRPGGNEEKMTLKETLERVALFLYLH